MSSRPKVESPRGTRSSSAPAAPGGGASESALNLLEHCLCPGGRDRLLSGHLKWTSLCADTLPCPCERPLPIPSPHLLVHEGATRSPGQRHRGRGTPAVCRGCSRQVAPPSLPSRPSAVSAAVLPSARCRRPVTPPSPRRAAHPPGAWPAGILQSSLRLRGTWLLSSELQPAPQVLRRRLQTPVSSCGRHLPGPPPESGHTHAAEGTLGPL